jgi:hypothetical protein
MGTEADAAAVIAIAVVKYNKYQQMSGGGQAWTALRKARTKKRGLVERSDAKPRQALQSAVT